MAAADKVRDWWERLQPRERTMVMALGVTFVVCTLGFAAITIGSGLDSIASKNDETRDALGQLQKHRIAIAKGTAATAKDVQIPDKEGAVDLEDYLNKVAKEVGVAFPKFNRDETARGEFIERSGRIEFKDVTIYELKDFLQKVESNPLVYVREIRVKQDFRDNEKLDVPEMLVATLYKKKVEEDEEEE